jgi:hypothetical protein
MENFREKLLEALESEDVWLDFNSGSFIPDSQVREMIATGKLDTDDVSSRPDVFPVVGDLKAATKALHKAVMVFQDDETEETQAEDETEDSSVVHYECHPGVAGFKNPGTSCFMDSTLMAMFFLQNSPFYEIFTSTFDAKTMSCSSDPVKNARLKKQVRDLMKSDVDKILAGTAGYECKALRKLIGDTCKGGENEQDMSKGMHDAGEFLLRLLSIMNYTPMQLMDTISYPDQPDREGDSVKMSEVWLNVPTTQGKPHISWPDYWSPSIFYNEITNQKVQTDRNFVSAEVIIVHVTRGAPGSGLGLNNRPITLDREMRVTFTSGEARAYVLRAAVYPPNAGHYCALLKCNENWYKYDDQEADEPYQSNQLSDSEVEKILSTKATLLFYY